MSLKPQGVGVSIAHKRAGDGDRKGVAEQLRVALEEGRLELGEYDERVQNAYKAKTYGDLDELLADIPDAIPASRSQLEPATSKQTDGKTGEEDDEKEDWSDIRSMWMGWGFMAMMFVGIWFITSIAGDGLNYFWPVWPLGFTALGMSIATVSKLLGRDR